MEVSKPHHSQAYSLLTNNQALKHFRSDSSASVRILAINAPLLRDLLDISFRPKHFQTTKDIKLTPDLPQLATETLSTLYQDFINLLAYDKIVNRDRTVEASQMQQERNQAVIAQNSQEFTNLKYLHKVFESPQADDASMSNLSRILGPLYYHCPQKIIEFYENSPYHKTLFFEQLWRRQIIQFFCKLMEIEVGNQFFKDFKHKCINQFYETVKQNLKTKTYHQWLESVRHLHKFIGEKIEERYDGSKFNVLLQILSKNDQVLVKIVIQNFHNYGRQTILVCQQWLQQSLKKDSLIMCENSAKGGTTSSRRKSIQNSFYVDQKLKNTEHRITIQYITSTSIFLKLCMQKHLNEPNTTAFFLISFYRTIYYWVKNACLWIGLINGDQVQLLISQIITQKFFQNAFKAIVNHPRSTILHNQIKELILVCLQRQRISGQYFIKEDSAFRKILTQWLPRKQSGLQIPFGAQSYYIYLQLIKMDVEISDQILDLIATQKSRRQKLIGGVDPRKLSDNLRSSANNYSSSSQEQSIQEIEINIPSLQNTNQLENSAQSPKKLKLINTTSLQKSNMEIEEKPLQKNQEGSDSD